MKPLILIGRKPLILIGRPSTPQLGPDAREGVDRERWPCGCAKGYTPHGAGWSDCIATNEDRARWEVGPEPHKRRLLMPDDTAIWEALSRIRDLIEASDPSWQDPTVIVQDILDELDGISVGQEQT